MRSEQGQVYGDHVGTSATQKHALQQMETCCRMLRDGGVRFTAAPRLLRLGRRWGWHAAGLRDDASVEIPPHKAP